MRRASVVLAAVPLVLLGGVVGVVGAFQHPRAWHVGTNLPVGVVVALGGLLLAQLLAGAAGRAVRAPAAAPLLVSVGWVLCVVPLAGSGGSGDVVVPGDGRGSAFFWGGLLVCMLGPFVVATLGEPVQGRREDRR